MDRKLIIGGVVAALLAIGGVAYMAMTGGGKAPVAESAPVPATQLQNEIQPASGQPGAPVPKMPDGRPLPM